MFFFIRSCALTKFSAKLAVLVNLLVLSNFDCLKQLVLFFFDFFLNKMRKKFAQTNIYYKFALA